MDHSPVEGAAQDDADERRVVVNVAGAGALLVAKLHKIADRAERPDRLVDKDAGDVLRLFTSTTPDAMARSLGRLIADPRSASATRVALGRLDGLFGTPRSVGVQMAVRTLDGVLDPATVEAALTGFAAHFLAALADT